MVICSFKWLRNAFRRSCRIIKSDIKLDSDIPHIELKPHSWRSLKTKGSERNIPLVGASLWAAQSLQNSDSSFAFPRYVKNGHCYTNSASAALNKWLRPRVPINCSMHSFRHSMRDRLRSVQCPSDIADQIGGWTTSGVGQGYGSGYPLEVLHQWVEKAMTLWQRIKALSGRKCMNYKLDVLHR